MNATSGWLQRSLAALAILGILGLGFAGGYAQAPSKDKGDKKDPSAKPAEGKKAEPAKLHIKVFRLKHTMPEELNQVLEELLPEGGEVALGPAGAMGPGAGGLPGGFGVLGGGPAMPGGGFGALGGALGAVGGLGGLGGNMGGNSWRLSFDNRTRSLIIRGSDQNLQVAADLVAVLDQPADKALPKVKSLHAYKLKHAQAEELSNILSNLELDARIVSLKSRNILVVSGPEDVMKEIDGVVEALDVEVKDLPGDKEKKSSGE